ncbi:MAG: 4Fe-4S binding protein [Nitrospirota bacterium]
MNIVKDSYELRVKSYELKDKKTLNSERRTPNSLLNLSKLRRIVLLAVIMLFLLQFLRVKVLVGGLSGSVAVWFVRLIDVYAYFESLIASKDFTFEALIAVLPIIGIYLIFGRAFCGWVCPIDFLYEVVDKIKFRSQKSARPASQSEAGEVRSQKKILDISPKIGYVIAVTLLVISALIGIPFFTNYLSHLTNFFRAITGGVYLALNLPVDKTVLIFSGAVIFFLLVLEYFSPRLWCRVLCPVGKTYGLFNKISLIKLKFVEGECGECNLCEQVCHMNVKITPYLDQQGLRDINCIYCGRCVEGCGTKGKLIKIKLSPLSSRPRSKYGGGISS